MPPERTNLEGLSGALLLNPEQVLVFKDESVNRLVGKQTTRVPGITSDKVRERNRL